MTARIGLVDGSVEASTRRFSVVLDDDAVAQLDDLVSTTQTLPDGRLVTHYGIVVEGTSSIEGADFASDTARIARDRTMPGVTSRRVEVQVLRTVPELWLAPAPGAAVAQAIAEHREQALFLDQMERAFGVGVDQSGQPVYADFSFMNGEKGGHVSISGISGVATKTTYALFLLYMLFETEQGRRMLGPEAANTKALVFNVKGEDLLHLDRPNARFHAHPDAEQQWQALGVDTPGRFEGVHLFAPRSPESREGVIAVDVHTREGHDVEAFAWTPEEFIRQGLLRFCLTDAEDSRNQLSFVEQRVRVQLVRWAYPLENEPGAVVMCPPPAHTSFNVDRLLHERRDPRQAHEGDPIRSFSDLVDFLTSKLAPEEDTGEDTAWSAGVQGGTRLAFVRRLYAQTPRVGHLVALGCRPPQLDRHVTVVDIHSLHQDAQRFVVGALLNEIFEAKQGQGREPLRFIVLDELNKYAPRQGTSPLKDLMIDISARGRSLGVLLIGAQQSIGNVAPEIFTNAALKVAGRLDAGEADQYRFLTPELRERAARFLPGTMVLDQPLIPAPIPLRFPFPGFATNVSEDQGLSPEAEAAATEELWDRL